MAEEYELEKFDPDKLDSIRIRQLRSQGVPAPVQPAKKKDWYPSLPPPSTYRENLDKYVSGYPGGTTGYVDRAKTYRKAYEDVGKGTKLPDERARLDPSQLGALTRLDDWTLNRENLNFQSPREILAGTRPGTYAGGMVFGNDAYGSGGERRGVAMYPRNPKESSVQEESIHMAQYPTGVEKQPYVYKPTELGAKLTAEKQKYVKENWPNERRRKSLYATYPYNEETGRYDEVIPPANLRQYDQSDSVKLLKSMMDNPKLIRDSSLREMFESEKGKKHILDNLEYWIQFMNETAAAERKPPGMFTGQQAYA